MSVREGVGTVPSGETQSSLPVGKKSYPIGGFLLAGLRP